MEFNDGNSHHYVTDPRAYLAERRMYEMRTCSADPKNGYRMYVDVQFARQRAMLQPELDAYLHYQFPWERAGTPEQQAEFFCEALGELRGNEMVMLDTEDKSALRDPAEFSRRWWAFVEPALNTLSWSYVPNSLAKQLTRTVTGPRIVKAPKYSGHAVRGKPPGWTHDVHQYTDRGYFPGSAQGPGDCNYTSMTIEEMLARCRPGRRTLRLGDRGEDVRELQAMLREVG